MALRLGCIRFPATRHFPNARNDPGTPARWQPLARSSASTAARSPPRRCCSTPTRARSWPSAAPTTSSSPRRTAPASRTRLVARRAAGGGPRRRSRTRPAPRSRGSGSPGSSTGWSPWTPATARSARRSCGTTPPPPDYGSLTERMGGEDAVLAATGNVFLPGYTAPKIAVAARARAGPLRRAAPVLPAARLPRPLAHRRVRHRAGDASGTAYVDARTRAYAPSRPRGDRRRARLGRSPAADPDRRRSSGRCARRGGRSLGLPAGSRSRWAGRQHVRGHRRRCGRPGVRWW